MKNNNESFVRNISNIIKEYKKSLLLAFLGLLVIYSFLYGIWRIPIIDFGINRTSEITIIDYLFIIVIALLSALFIVFLRYEKYSKFSAHSTTGAGGIGVAGIVSTACPACQSIAVVGLGSTFFNIPTGFLTPYLGLLKILSVGLLSLAVFIKADSIYNKTCRSCNVKKNFKK